MRHLPVFYDRPNKTIETVLERLFESGLAWGSDNPRYIEVPEAAQSIKQLILDSLPPKQSENPDDYTESHAYAAAVGGNSKLQESMDRIERLFS